MSNRYEVHIGRGIGITKLFGMLKLYNDIITSDYHVSLIKGLLLLRKSLNGYIMIYDNKTHQIAGIATILSLKDQFCEAFKEGRVCYNDIRVRDLNNLSKPSDGVLHHFYLGIIGVNPKVNDRFVVFKLLSELNSRLLSFAKKGIIGDEIIADVVSPEGERLSNIIGMKYLTTNTDGSRMYSVSLMPFELSYKSGPYTELKNFYENNAI